VAAVKPQLDGMRAADFDHSDVRSAWVLELWAAGQPEQPDVCEGFA
jgi:hypothetical protein